MGATAEGRDSSREASIGAIELEPVAGTGGDAGAHHVIWMLGSWVAIVVLVAVGVLAVGAVEAPEDRATAVETITDLGGLRSAIPGTSESSRPFRMTMEMDIESEGDGLSGSFGMSMDMRSDGQRSAIELSMLGRTTSMLASTDIIYLPTVGGEGWVAYRMPDVDTAATSMFRGADPLAMLNAMSSRHPVELVGHETIDGIDATHYRVRNDVSGLLKDTVSSESQLEAIERLGFGALPTMTVDAWIDADGMMRRMDMGIDAAGSTLTMVMRIYDVEESAEITIPTDAEGPFDVDPSDPAGRFNTHLIGLLTG
ncbi:MAG TPA: hypothetical protein VMN58_01175 [Acidimicrobiales bacterium]|nr:hypothetical protein [Acidimicrobiales bacterium]